MLSAKDPAELEAISRPEAKYFGSWEIGFTQSNLATGQLNCVRVHSHNSASADSSCWQWQWFPAHESLTPTNPLAYKGVKLPAHERFWATGSQSCQHSPGQAALQCSWMTAWGSPRFGVGWPSWPQSWVENGCLAVLYKLGEGCCLHWIPNLQPCSGWEEECVLLKQCFSFCKFVVQPL